MIEPIMNINCPECGEHLSTEENIMDVCGNPNGTVIQCACGAEMSWDIFVKVEVI